MIIIRKETRRVILVMIVLVLIGITVAWFYYRSVNRSEDPRVVQSKLKFQEFQQIAETQDYEYALTLLDTIQQIYSEYDHYKNSYETGVLYNYRSAIFLTQALHHAADSTKKEKYFLLAGENAQRSIDIYQAWLDQFETLSEEEIQALLQQNFALRLDVGEGRKEKIIRKRIKEIQEAQYETKRRMSVSYTNLGIVYRHHEQVEEAARCYQKALELWGRNLSAKNNLNIILDRPLEKQNLIERVFPPEKDKE